MIVIKKKKTIFYVTKINTIQKMGLEKKIFDWVCFLNNICAYCPRKIKKVFFRLTDVKKIKNNHFLNKIFQINIWKNTLKGFKIKKINKFKSVISNIPFYNLNQFFKNKIKSLNQLLIDIDDLTSFILTKFKTEIYGFLNTKNFFTTNLFFLIFFSLKKFKKIFIGSSCIHFQCKVYGKNINTYFTKIDFFKRLFFYKILLQYYNCLFNFIFKKFFIFYSFKFIKSYHIDKYHIQYLSVSSFPKNYEYRINDFLVPSQSTKYKKIYYNLSNIKKFIWIFSKNTNRLHRSCIPINFIFYFDYRCATYYLITLVRCLTISISFAKNNKKITHIISSRTKKHSLLCLVLKISWIWNVLNNHNKLPNYLNQTKIRKKISINLFFLCAKNQPKISFYYFRYKYGKKRIYNKEFYFFLKTWFIEKNFLKKYNLKKIKFVNYTTFLNVLLN